MTDHTQAIGPADETKPPITVEQLDEAVVNVVKLREAYKAAKKLSDTAHEEQRIAEAKLLVMLEEAHKDTYIVSGVGRVSVVHELSVQTPKTVEQKKAFFEYLAKHKGQDVADHYMTINSQALNSLYKELDEEFSARGEVFMPAGLDAPIARVSLSLRKA